MTPSQLAAILPYYIAERMPVFLKGPPGVGKSDCVRQAGAAMKLEVRDTMRGSQMDPTDIKGFPAPDAKKGVMKWLTPEFLPTDPKSKGILFLDELTSAPIAVQAAMYQLVLDRRVGEYVLPDGWAIVAAGNREGDKSVVNRMPKALANRMAHLNIEPSLDCFIKWQRQHKPDMSPYTSAFLRFRSGLLHNMENQGEDPFPSPRSWVMADQIMRRGHDVEVALEAVAGVVGKGAANEYVAFFSQASQLPDPDQIALDPLGTPVPESPSALYATAGMLDSVTTDVKTFRAYMPYVLRMPREFQVVYIRDQIAQKAHHDVTVTTEFRDWCVANRDIVV